MRLATTLALLWVTSALSSPTPLPQSTTFIDALSDDPDFTLFLRLVQRAKLVPTLNQINGSTLFAPTNDAIERSRQPLWSHALNSNMDDDALDNIQEQLRQHIYYHLLNYTLEAFPQSTETQLTLHFPAKPIQPPSKDPPPFPPWMPIPGGLLGGQPQRLRLSTRDDSHWVGVDAVGQGGVKVVKEPVPVSNGILYAVDRVVPLPRDLAYEVAHNPSLSNFARLLPKSLVETLAETPHLTLFFPVNDAWEALDPIERRYLESGFAEKDMEKIVQLHTSKSGSDGEGSVGWSENWLSDKLTDFNTIQGHTVHVNSTDNTVSGSPIVDRDVYASNGVLHTVSSLLLNPNIFQLNAEKYLLALNATSFVSLLRAANMSHYVDDEHDGKSWTILAPRDDIFSEGNRRSSASAILSDFVNGLHVERDQLETVLKYHIIPGRLLPKDLEDGSLIGTELREAGLSDGRQKIPVAINGKTKTDVTSPWSGNGEISFGGATVISNAIEIGGSVIYVISKILEPPADVIESSLPNAELSTFLTSVFATHLDKELRKEPSTTLLIPRNSAWSPLGLLANHLLLPESRLDLERVVKHHVLKEVVYSRDSALGSDLEKRTSRTFRTWEGSDLRIDGGHVIPSGSWSNDMVVVPQDTLTRTGVTHELEGPGILIPRSVKVNVGDLANAGKASIMIGLVQKAGYGGVLDGTLKLDMVEWSRRNGGRVSSEDKGKRPTAEVGWTLLCPNDDAFKGLNLTHLLEDEVRLKRLVQQHLIPAHPSLARPLLPKPITEDNPNRPLPLVDDATFDTLLSPSSSHGSVVIRATGSSPTSFLVGIRGAKGSAGGEEYANVLNYGRTTSSPSISEDNWMERVEDTQSSLRLPKVDAGFGVSPDTELRSGVILIDRVLMPYVEGWWTIWGQGAAVGVSGGAVIIAGTWFLLMWWRKKSTEATYEPIGVQEDE